MAKTVTQAKFDTIVKKGFWEVLKPLGFKKKADSFYRPLPEIGQVIRVQKESRSGAKEEISFTINIGIFVPELWLAQPYNAGKELPTFPEEPHCLIRRRIRELTKKVDWFDIFPDTDENVLIAEMITNVNDYILPFLSTMQSRKDVLSILEREVVKGLSHWKLMLYGELQMHEEAKVEYQKLISQNYIGPGWLETYQELARKYGVIS